MWHYNYTDTLYHGNYSPAYMATDYDNSLSHYGVLGMKWGVRKQRESSGNRVGGRRQLSSRTKKLIRNAAIGAGATALGAGVAGLGYLGYRKLGGKQGLKAGVKMFNKARNSVSAMEKAGVKNTLAGYAMSSSKAVNRGAKLGASLGNAVGGIKRAPKNIASGTSQAVSRGITRAANSANLTARRTRYVLSNPTAPQNRRAIAKTVGKVALAGGATAGGVYGYNQYKKKKRK